MVQENCKTKQNRMKWENKDGYFAENLLSCSHRAGKDPAM